MRRFIARTIFTALAILIVTRLSDAVQVDSVATALTVACGIGLANALIRPVILFFTFPLTFLTLGLFRFIVNGALLYLISYVFEGFTVLGPVTAVWAAAAISILSFMLDAIIRPK